MKSSMNKGFTLVELLVVIGIIGLLVGLSLPAYKIVVARANSSKCLANLRGLGVALNGYLTDNQMIMPTLVAARDSTSEQEAAIDTVLVPYVDTKNVFICPAGRAIAQTTGTSYYWNSALNGQPVASLNFFGILKNLSGIPVLLDKAAWHQYSGNPVNQLFADGHAENQVSFVAQ
jgi:prepilin-type N-terminal cleavage/methylation domain-containing protein/prepilin-type processing-associated H-X9-DG protein